MTQEREFDIILFGATGFTGSLVAEELLARLGGRRWAIAGRDPAKLQAAKERLVALEPHANVVPILVADSHDRASLDALARRTRVVCTTVGPYLQHGADLVAACAANGTHYCDLTGETPFMRRTIEAHHALAHQTGARIVHACGFDSIPSDLGCLLADEAMRVRSGAPCDEATLYVRTLRGGASGGTIASMLGILDAAKQDPTVRGILLDPYALNPEGDRSGADGRDSLGIRSEPEGVTAPFFMAPINTRVVRRTNALLGWRYGRGFRYREVSLFPRSAKGWLAAASIAATLSAVMGGGALPGIRSLLGRALPKPGEGPSKEQREAGSFRLEVVGRQTSLGVDREVRVRVEGHRDPGYGFTAILLAESAMSLAFDPLESPGGVLTPASAMGMALVKRLRRAGMVLRAD